MKDTPLFLAPDIRSDLYLLSQEESKHCIRVLRMKRGDMLFLSDGKGTLYEAEITGVDLPQCEVRIKEAFQDYGKRNYHLHIAIAPTKNIDRFEWFLEKATEIGIDEITPLICTHSERKEVRIDRLNKIIESAMKQSIKAYHPVLNQALKFNSLISRPFNEQKLIAYLDENQPVHISKKYRGGMDVIILIGPEGDFSEEEIAVAKQQGFEIVSLGESRLRTETAGLVACQTISLLNEISKPL